MYVARALAACLLVLCAPAALAQEAPARNPDLNARIRGRVLSADSGASLAGAAVSLRGVRRPGADLASVWSETVTSGDDGRFEFAPIPPGDFTLNVNKPGYIGKSSIPVSVHERQTVPVTVAIARGGAISGRIVDGFGDPVAGVQVTALGQRTALGSETPAFRPIVSIVVHPGDLTDDLGRFRIFGLPPGEFSVVASVRRPVTDERLPGNSIASDVEAPPTYYPGTFEAAQAQKVLVGPGQEAFAEFALLSGRVYQVAGRAVTSNGTPTGGLVSLQAAGGSSHSTVRVAPDGSFEFPGIAPGSYLVAVQQPGQPREFGTANVIVDTSDVTGVSIVTSPGATLRGSIVYEGRSEPDPAYPVQILRFDGGPSFLGGTRLEAEEDGRFVATNNFGRVTFVAGDNNWTVTSVMYRGTEVLDRGIDVSGASEISGIRVTVSDRLTRVDGRAVDSRGRPLPDRFVVLQRLEGVPPHARDGLRVARTAADGTFTEWGLRPGSYVAVVIDSAEPPTANREEFFERMQALGKRFSLAEGQNQTIELEPAPGLP